MCHWVFLRCLSQSALESQRSTLCWTSLGTPYTSLGTLPTWRHLSFFPCQVPAHCTGCTRLCSETSALLLLQALQDGPAYDSFLKRWKLSVYFSLRFQVSHSSNICHNPDSLCFVTLPVRPHSPHGLGRTMTGCCCHAGELTCEL